MTKTERIN